jgi:hypothetical protein
VRRRALAVIAMLVAGVPPAAAQDALRGKRLYLDTAGMVGSEVSCVDCHGGLPGGAYGVDSAAGNPALVELAVASVPLMSPLRGRLAAADFVDLAAFIGDPRVASPALQVLVRPPGREAQLDERIELGDIAVGEASAHGLVQIRNVGRLAFTITGAPELAGMDAAEFALDAAACGAGATVAPAQSCELALVFRPVGAAGPRVARLSVSHDWVYGIVTVAVSGTAVLPGTTPADGGPDAGSGCRSGRGSTAGLLGAIAWVWLHRRQRRLGGHRGRLGRRA